MNAAAAIHAQGAGANMTADSGTMQNAQLQAQRRGSKEVISSRSNTKRKIMERQFTAAQSRGRGAQAKTAGYARATRSGIKFVSDSVNRGSVL